MIGSLKGTLLAKRPPWIELEVAGVGYEIEVPMSTFFRLPEVGERLTLMTHLVVREDAHSLYGFLTESERALFRSLLKVSGIGARIALGVLSGMTVEGFRRCIVDRDLGALTKVPGVGRKTAERLLVEMPDLLPAESAGIARAAANGAEGEAHGALIALGYKPSEVVKMMKDLDTARLSSAELIREALRRVHAGSVS